MSDSAPQFNPDAYKETMRKQWQQAGEAWYRWGPKIEEWLRPVTDAMVESAAIEEGYRVLDIAAGAGEPAVTVAKLVGPTGSVLATDISSVILGFARRHAEEEGVSNLETRVMDGESIDLPEASFDAAVSRLGLIYFPDRIRTLRQIHRVLRGEGRVAVVGITSPMANPFSAITMKVIAARANLPPPRPGGPGPFSLGSPALMREALESAGFEDVKTRVVDAPLRMESASQCARFQREAFAGLDQLLSALPASGREAAWDEVAAQLGPLESGGRFVSDAQFIVGSGARD